MTAARRRRQLALAARSLIGHTRRDLQQWRFLQAQWSVLQTILALNLDPLVRTVLQLQAAGLADQRSRLIRRYEPDSAFFALAGLAGDAGPVADRENWQMHDLLARSLYSRLVEATLGTRTTSTSGPPSARLLAAYLTCATVAEQLGPQFLRLGVKLPEGWKAAVSEAQKHPQYPGAKP